MASIRREVDRYWVGRVVVSALVVWLYLSACTRPVYLVHKGDAEAGKADTTVGGWQALTEGWLVVPFLPSWTANLWLLAGWACLLFGRYAAAAAFGRWPSLGRRVRRQQRLPLLRLDLQPLGLARLERHLRLVED